jgi:hypothetical protein
MDALAHFVHDFAKCTYFVMECDEALGYCDRLPLEIFELFRGLQEFVTWG